MLIKKTLVACALAVTCGTATPALPVQVAGTVGDVEFPSKSRAYLSEGDFVNVDDLRQMRAGLSKDQVRILLGNPHFNEGIFGSREWNYIFNFRTVGDEYITCQYQVRYDKVSSGYQSRSMHWDGPACLELTNAPAGVAAVARPAEVERRFNLSADVLFPFARFAMSDILPSGRAELDALAGQFAEANVTRVNVVGHTDRIGSDADNQTLSERRAASVRDYLIAKGVPAASAHAEGRGESQPLKSCDDALPRIDLIACLAPNRRVEIVVTGLSVL